MHRTINKKHLFLAACLFVLAFALTGCSGIFKKDTVYTSNQHAGRAITINANDKWKQDDEMFTYELVLKKTNSSYFDVDIYSKLDLPKGMSLSEELLADAKMFFEANEMTYVLVKNLESFQVDDKNVMATVYSSDTDNDADTYYTFYLTEFEGETAYTITLVISTPSLFDVEQKEFKKMISSQKMIADSGDSYHDYSNEKKVADSTVFANKTFSMAYNDDLWEQAENSAYDLELNSSSSMIGFWAYSKEDYVEGFDYTILLDTQIENFKTEYENVDNERKLDPVTINGTTLNGISIDLDEFGARVTHTAYLITSESMPDFFFLATVCLHCSEYDYMKPQAERILSTITMKDTPMELSNFDFKNYEFPVAEGITLTFYTTDRWMMEESEEYTCVGQQNDLHYLYATVFDSALYTDDFTVDDDLESFMESYSEYYDNVKVIERIAAYDEHGDTIQGISFSYEYNGFLYFGAAFAKLFQQNPDIALFVSLDSIPSEYEFRMNEVQNTVEVMGISVK